jgi:hypothetical protein
VATKLSKKKKKKKRAIGQLVRLATDDPCHSSFGFCVEYMDPMSVLRADLDAYIKGQRRQHSKTSSSTKSRSTKVMSSPSLPPAPPAVSRVGPICSPVATHEASGVVGDAGFPSVFLKQASVPPLLANFTQTEFRAWLLEFRSFLTRFHLHMFLDRTVPSSSVIPDQGAAIV